MEEDIKFIEVFAGIGGFRFGLEACNRKQQENTEVSGCRYSLSDKGKQSDQSEVRRNYTCVYANDNDKYACQIYRKRFGNTSSDRCELLQREKQSTESSGNWHEPSNLHEGDIRTVDPATIPEHDLLCAGFPCQSFSIAGKRGGFEDTRGTLFFEICRILRAKRTPYVLLENVKGLLSHDNGDTFQTILGTLDELGYDCQWQVLNSKAYVPQNRERVFIIGHSRNRSRPKVFPIGESNGLDIKQEPGLQDTQTAVSLRSTDYKGTHNMIHTAYPGETREYEDVSPTISTPSGDGHLPYVAEVKPVLTPDRAKKRQNGRRMKEDGEPMFTLTGQDIHGIEIANCVDVDGYLRTGARPRDADGKPQLLPIGYRRIRRLTPTECARLQGFPDNWCKNGLTKDGKTVEISDTQQYKCFGNAVTTNAITAIGKQLLAEIEKG